MRNLACKVNAIAASFVLLPAAMRGEPVEPVIPLAEATPAERSGMCGLLKHDEIEALIGSKIVRDKSSQSFNGNLSVAQCVYVAAQADKSVSVVLTKRDPKRAGTQTAVG